MKKEIMYYTPIVNQTVQNHWIKTSK